MCGGQGQGLQLDLGVRDDFWVQKPRPGSNGIPAIE